MPRIDDIRPRRGTTAEWTSANPVLFEGEFGLDEDTGVLKYGDGATAWLSLTDAVRPPAGLAPTAVGNTTLVGGTKVVQAEGLLKVVAEVVGHAGGSIAGRRTDWIRRSIRSLRRSACAMPIPNGEFIPMRFSGIQVIVE